jgi:hypothetical protein
MDTSEVKTNPNQEAGNSAGLLQLDQRSTTASSEEDRLAAEISTICASQETLQGAAEKTKQHSTLYAVARLWLASTIMFSGVWSLNRQT